MDSNNLNKKNHIWTSQDYLKLFSSILNIPLDEDTFLITGIGKSMSSKQKLFNKNTHLSCKVKAFLSQIKCELGKGCFSKYSVDEIKENLSIKSLDIIYRGLMQTKVIRDLIPDIEFNQAEYEEIFAQAHTDEWTRIKAITANSSEKVLYLSNICSEKVYAGIIRNNINKELLILDKVCRNPCSNKSFIYHVERGYNKIIVEAKCPNCNFSIKYNAIDCSTISSTTLSDRYRGFCSNINKEYEWFINNKSAIDLIIDLLKEIREQFSCKVQNLLAEATSKGVSSNKAVKLFNKINGISYIYDRKKNCFNIFDMLVPIADIQNNQQHIKQKIVIKIEQKIKEMNEKINEEVEKQKQFHKDLQNFSSLTTTLMCINAVGGYGRTTYIELLKGSKSKKMIEYGLVASPYYGSMEQYIKKDIDEVITSLMKYRLIEIYYGRYDRHRKYPKLRLTQAGAVKVKELLQKEQQGEGTTNQDMDIMNQNEDILNWSEDITNQDEDITNQDQDITNQKEYISSWNESLPEQEIKNRGNSESEKGNLSFINKLNLCTPEEKSRMLESIDISCFTETEFMEFIQFVLTQRSVYRNVESSLIEVFNTMPDRYIPIIEMNAQLENGVVKKTLKTIIDNAKERVFKCTT